MVPTPNHLTFLVKEETLITNEGKEVEMYKLEHSSDEDIMHNWAKHFRDQYCDVLTIDRLRQGTGLSRRDYMKNIKLPDDTIPPGPSIRAGDFSEILISDYLQYVLQYWVPRTKYNEKAVRNESTKGCDVLGIKIINDDMNDNAELAIYEVKAQLTQKSNNTRLQDAVNDSGKDYIRLAETLNAIKQRYIDKNETENVYKIERFQNCEDNPYHKIYGAVAVLSTINVDNNTIINTETTNHIETENLKLLIVYGDEMMELVTELYRRVADEA